MSQCPTVNQYSPPVPSTLCLCARRPGAARARLDDASVSAHGDKDYSYENAYIYAFTAFSSVVYAFFRTMRPVFGHVDEAEGTTSASSTRMATRKGGGVQTNDPEAPFMNGQMVAHKDFPKMPVVFIGAMRGAFAQGCLVDAVPEALREYWSADIKVNTGPFTVLIVYQPFASIGRAHDGKTFFYRVKDQTDQLFSFMQVEDVIAFEADDSDALCLYVSVFANSSKYPRTSTGTLEPYSLYTPSLRGSIRNR